MLRHKELQLRDEILSKVASINNIPSDIKYTTYSSIIDDFVAINNQFIDTWEECILYLKQFDITVFDKEINLLDRYCLEDLIHLLFIAFRKKGHSIKPLDVDINSLGLSYEAYLNDLSISHKKHIIDIYKNQTLGIIRYTLLYLELGYDKDALNIISLFTPESNADPILQYIEIFCHQKRGNLLIVDLLLQKLKHSNTL